MTARNLYVTDDAGDNVVVLGTKDGDNGVVLTRSATGKDLVELPSTVDDESVVTTYQPYCQPLVLLGLTNPFTGGMIQVNNKTGETIVNVQADEYGNGVAGAYNH